MKASLILPNQLFTDNPIMDIDSTIILIEHQRYFCDFKFHKNKLLLHRASMKAYAEKLISNGCNVVYVEFSHSLLQALRDNNISKLIVIDPVDHKIYEELKAIESLLAIEIKVVDNPAFLTQRNEIAELLGKNETYFFTHFYIRQRKKLNILIDGKKPVGKSWTYDKYNREKFPSNEKIPERPHFPASKHIKEALHYIEKNFSTNPGITNNFCYPTTTDEARILLDNFLKKQLSNFGIYQDAIVSDSPFLFHSLLSAPLNSGLITPKEVIEKTLLYAKSHDIPLNSLEGFIRQIIGWREYVRCVYMVIGKEQSKSNFFNHIHKLPQKFWNASTNIVPVDKTISRVLDYSYAHHIERLMILGNFMLLCTINPSSVYSWFMELFIDAYDWVMVPNVFGMSQYADGGMITTKPYISSSRYILKMSDYGKDSWCSNWDNLYWAFLINNHKKLVHNPRMAFVFSHLHTMTNAQKLYYIKQSDLFLDNMFS